MTTSPRTLDARTLLEHMDWVRALARELVRDAELAEDVAQETARLALERPPRDTGNLRAWFASAARNVARGFGRAAARREEHEGRAARPASAPSAAELVAEAGLQRELVGHVLELAEPYRSVLVLRYFRDLSPAEIATQLGLPHNTVRSQLARALAQLRERLDRTQGGRATWLSALAPLAGRTGAGAGAGIVAASLLAVIAAALLLVGLGRLSASGEPRHDQPLSRSVGGAAARGEGTASSGVADLASVAGEARQDARPADLKGASLTVRLLDSESRRPLAGVGFALFSERAGDHLYARGVTGEDGTAVIDDLPPDMMLIESDRTATHAAAFGAVWHAGRGSSAVELLAGPGSSLRGRVLDELGQPREGIEVFHARSRRVVGLDGPEENRLVTATDVHGRYVVEHVVALPQGVWIVDGSVRAGGTTRVALVFRDPATGVTVRQDGIEVRADGVTEVHDIEVRRGAWIEGRVLDELETPIEGALVSARWWPTDSRRTEVQPGEDRTDAAGRFRIGVPKLNMRVILGVRTPEGAAHVESIPALAPDGVRSEVVLRVPRARPLHLRVRSAAGGELFQPLRSTALESWDRGPSSLDVSTRAALTASFAGGDRTSQAVEFEPDGRAVWFVPRALAELRVLRLDVPGFQPVQLELSQGAEAGVEYELTCTPRPRLRLVLSWKDDRRPSDLHALELRACLRGEPDRGPRGTPCCGLGSYTTLKLADWRPSRREQLEELYVDTFELYWLHIVARPERGRLAPRVLGPFLPGEQVHRVEVDPEFSVLVPAPPKQPPSAAKEPLDEARLSAEVLDAATGAAVNWTVRLASITEVAPGEPSAWRTAGARSDGVAAVEAGEWRVSVRARGYRSADAGTVRLAAGAQHHLGSFRLEPIPVVRVRLVRAASGAPVPEANVFTGAVSARYVGEGRFEFRDAEPEGEWLSIRIHDSSDVPLRDPARSLREIWPAEQQVARLDRSGSTFEQEIALPPERRVEIVVRGIPPGRQRAALVLELRRTDAGDVAITAWPSPGELCGERRFRAVLGAGDYSVRAISTLLEVSESTFTVEAGSDVQTVELEVR